MEPTEIPTVVLNTGQRMPMIAFGTGMLPLNSLKSQQQTRKGKNRGNKPGRQLAAVTTVQQRRRLANRLRRSAIPALNASLSLGYNHLDMSEVYPDFAEAGKLIRPHRHRLWVTSKVDPTIAHEGIACVTDGGGCDAAMRSAANSTVSRLGFAPDLLLLHRPPKRMGSDAAQCKRLQGLWRGMEQAQRGGLAKAIGLSNVCGPLLHCLSLSLSIKPAVVQYMHHVGMGNDPLGYRSWTRRVWGSAYMAYSVLGGAEQDFGQIVTAPAVAAAARAHSTHAANIALSWVAQQEMPLVIISSKPSHMKENLNVFTRPRWGKLSAAEMQALSELKKPAGRPAYWGDCRDAAPSG